MVVDDQGETEPLIQDNNGDTGNVGAPALDTPVAEAPVQTINGGQEIANNDTNNPDDPAWGNSEDPDWQIE